MHNLMGMMAQMMVGMGVGVGQRCVLVWEKEGRDEGDEDESNNKKRTAPSVPKWSPTSVLTGPDQA